MQYVQYCIVLFKKGAKKKKNTHYLQIIFLHSNQLNTYHGFLVKSNFCLKFCLSPGRLLDLRKDTYAQVLKFWWDKTSIPQVLSLLKLGLHCYNPQRSFGLLWATSPPPALYALPLFSFLLLAFSSSFPQSYLAAPPALCWCLFWCLPGPSSNLISLAAFLWLHVWILWVFVCVCEWVSERFIGDINCEGLNKQ